MIDQLPKRGGGMVVANGALIKGPLAISHQPQRTLAAKARIAVVAAVSRTSPIAQPAPCTVALQNQLGATRQPDVPPPFIAKVIPRSEANVGDYAEWAQSFAVLTRNFIDEIAGRAVPWGMHNLFQRGWKPSLGKADCYYRYVGDDCVWADMHGQRWVIELTHPSHTGCDPQILTATLGALPILCPSLPLAARLAEASHPGPADRHPIHWHSYW
jgi:hypothetical protein